MIRLLDFGLFDFFLLIVFFSNVYLVSDLNNFYNFIIFIYCDFYKVKVSCILFM